MSQLQSLKSAGVTRLSQNQSNSAAYMKYVTRTVALKG